MISTLMLVIISSSFSTAHSLATEVVTEAATAEIEATALVVALGLVVYGGLTRRGNPYAPVVAALGFLLALVTLGVAVRTDGWSVGIDGSITGWLVDHRSAPLDHIAVAVTTAGGPPETAALGFVIAAVLIWRTKRWFPALTLLATVALSAVVCTALKLVVGRDRPPLAIQLMLETDHSFPSGHVTGTATLLMMTALVVGQQSRRRRQVLMTAALAVTALVAASRLYLGVHWFTDVCAGLLLACFMVTLGSSALRVGSGRTLPARSHTKEEVTV
ncbi:phosphatase PAP2 family protein [Rhodococcoides kyotonense]|uniref:Undecaprenyl-diphosphatase n=1 Tax=Rhodococcoides kyotonense TaxID=398843 RepID=A0A239H3Q0_9NOCA|nr:phosphatase PAP2 family protein [Rhodococcus kyotonensis]SNS75832.1 undecaprenyl-diphosphatase [Rhodococcus kyotonensis]